MATSKISFSEFNILCEKGLVYNGFVDSVGYIYWTPEILYFIERYDIYKNKSYYQQVAVMHKYAYQSRGIQLIQKTKYNLHVIKLDELEFTHKDIYNEYYNKITPLKTDAIKASWSSIGSGTNGESRLMNTISGHASDFNAITKPLSGLDGVAGEALDIASMVSGVKKYL